MVKLSIPISRIPYSNLGLFRFTIVGVATQLHQVIKQKPILTMLIFA